MGKKAAAEPEPTEEVPVERPETPPVQLQGDFIFPDGSEYSGQYIKKKDESVTMHGTGHFRSGPEDFKGTFEMGMFKLGTYKTCNGAVYSGNFLNDRYNGLGEYTWSGPEGRKRIYRGMWKDGKMHGRGNYDNVSIGIDRQIAGFSIGGRFQSSAHGQQEALEAYLAEYGSEYRGSSIAAVNDLVTKAEAIATKGGAAVKDYAVPLPPPQGEVEDAGSQAERAAIEEVVTGPFPELATANLAALQKFAAMFTEEAENPGTVKVLQNGAECTSINGERLKFEQLGHIGQAVEFLNPAADGGEVKVMLLVNVSREYDVTKAAWKVICYEELPLTEEQLEALQNEDKKGKKGK